MNFTDQFALVTGGSSGIGLALAKQLAAHGANVLILARNQARLDAACMEISACRRSPHQRVDMRQVDVADEQQVTKALTDYTQQVGTPDLVINAAGVSRPGRFEEMDANDFRWMMDINYFGTVHVTRAIVPAMILRRSGCIVNISSIAGFLGIYGYSAYGPTKYAVRGFSDVIRSELREHNIRVSVVFPPDTQTPQLDYENQFKPPILQKLDETNHIMTPDAVAASILKGITRGQYIITPGFDSTLFFHLSNLFGNLTYPVMDFLVAQARRSLRTAKNNGRH